MIPPFLYKSNALVHKKRIPFDSSCFIATQKFNVGQSNHEAIQLKEIQLLSYHRVQGTEYAETSTWTILVDHLACDGVFPAPLCLKIVVFAFES